MFTIHMLTKYIAYPLVSVPGDGKHLGSAFVTFHIHDTRYMCICICEICGEYGVYVCAVCCV